jgi:hypothetical protein
MRTIKNLLTLCVLLTSVISKAQIGGGNPPPPPLQPPPSGPGLPIDGSILILIVGGLILGAYFTIKNYRKNNA